MVDHQSSRRDLQRRTAIPTTKTGASRGRRRCRIGIMNVFLTVRDTSAAGEEDRSPKAFLERFPLGRNHLIEKESLGFNELEHVLIKKVEQLFRNML
jgi:hypothetical protein